MPGISPLARKAAQRIFLAGDRLGVHVLPVHYYTPVASRKNLRARVAVAPSARPVPFPWDLDEQSDWMSNNGRRIPVRVASGAAVRQSARVPVRPDRSAVPL